jgi:hypothetical protein
MFATVAALPSGGTTAERKNGTELQKTASETALYRIRVDCSVDCVACTDVRGRNELD